MSPLFLLCEHLIALVTLFLFIATTYFRWSYNYWHRMKFPYLAPSVPYGNLPRPSEAKTHLSILLKQFYKEIKANQWKHAGIYFLTRPIFVPADLDLIKHIMAKDYKHFSGRGFYMNRRDDPLSAHLGLVSGGEWRARRSTLNPLFSPIKTKSMFEVMLQCEDKLVKDMMMKMEQPVDIRKIATAYTVNVVGTCVYGIDLESISKLPLMKLIDGVKNRKWWKSLLVAFYITFPNLARALHVRLFDKSLTDCVIQLVNDIVHFREVNNFKREDLMQQLMDLKNSEEYAGKFTNLNIAAEALVFFMAGFETSAGTISFVLYELAKNQDLQNRARQEIYQVLRKHNNEITYDSLQQMKYLGQIIEESLRKYPILAYLTRQCTEDYKLPDEDVVLEKDTMVLIPVYAIHHDEEYYPDPEKFDPERFSDENRSHIPSFAQLGFGEGPKICIGKRMGQTQTKLGLVSLIKNFKFELNKKTEDPLTMAAHGVSLREKDAIWLDVVKI